MKKYFFILTIVLNLIYIQEAKSQHIVGVDDFESFLSQKFYLQTFQIQKFIDRFNFLEPILVPGKEVSRAFNILCLINGKDEDLLRAPATQKFIEQVGKDTIWYRLSKNEKDWNVYVSCRFMYKGKSLVLTLKMQYAGDIQSGYKWVVSDVAGKLFEKRSSEKTCMINPSNNEVGFSELSKALKEKEDMIAYTHLEVYCPLSSFRDYVRNGDIEFSQVDTIQYVFENIGGWNITVDYFTRMDLNAGWLISSVKNENIEK